MYFLMLNNLITIDQFSLIWSLKNRTSSVHNCQKQIYLGFKLVRYVCISLDCFGVLLRDVPFSLRTKMCQWCWKAIPPFLLRKLESVGLE